MDFGWRFALGHAADIARDFNFGLNQRTFAKQGVNVLRRGDGGFRR